jgi:hypothetical protein
LIQVPAIRTEALCWCSSEKGRDGRDVEGEVRSWDAWRGVCGSEAHDAG